MGGLWSSATALYLAGALTLLIGGSSASANFPHPTGLHRAATATLTYDLNENLRYDGSRAFDYDEENRLTRVTVTNAFKTETLYDGLGRRRIRYDYTWAGSWIESNEPRFIINRIIVIQERDSNNVVLA